MKAEDLVDVPRRIFENGRKYLEQLGRLGAGQAHPALGDDYSLLPGQDGVNGPYTVPHNAIAQFYHDGGMLLAASHPAFNDTLEAAFGTMKPRIVDAALKTGGFFVFVRRSLACSHPAVTIIATDDVRSPGRRGHRY